MKILALVLSILVSQGALSAPDKAGLRAAWEQAMRAGGAELEAGETDAYRLVDPNLPYDGELKLVGLTVRADGAGEMAGAFSHSGFVEFQLSNLQPPLLHSQTYYLWAGDRQNFFYFPDHARWTTAQNMPTALSAGSPRRTIARQLWTWLPILILLLMVAFVVFLIRKANGQQRRAGSIIEDSAALNVKARENLEFARKMHEEQIAIARSNNELMQDNNRLLGELVETLGKRR